MVVFTCQNCNSCLKKKAVEKHLFKCKNPQLTCIDCLKDFDTQTYIAHLTCVTENERYGGQAFVPSTAMQKQNQWQQSIHLVLERNISPPVVKNIVKYASENPNCPRIKKKFTNFILNNRAFKSKEAAETAFDLISEEFTKTYNSSNQEKSCEGSVATDKSSGGKRKTISETEVPETTDENLTQKTSKELNKEAEKTNGLTENGISQKKNKKKDKRTNSVNKIDEESSKTNGLEDEKTTEEHTADSTHSKKKKKNKDKQRKNSSAEQNLTEDNLECTSEKENTPEDDEERTNLNGGEIAISELPKEEDLSKLTKKERKKLLKQKKYEAEINSIENYRKEDEVSTQAGEEEGEKRKKKKKKHLVEEEEEENRQKKRSISEPEDKKIKLEDYPVEPEEAEITEIEKPKKFKWDEVIIQVLSTQDDGEMSLKRLSKKICAEYANVYGERESYEEVMLKFNKKVVRTPGVRVFKDRAKLLVES